MRLKQYWPLLTTLFIISALFITKVWRSDTQASLVQNSKITGPAIILFRGDKSPNCQMINQLVSEAEQRYGHQITFRQFDWSADNPLIAKYKVRFLPTVLFIDSTGKEVTRSVGESPTVQVRLKNTLARLNHLLLQ
ncbi:MAG TPA: thioredoxin [Gammaproteobacteria bacterium]|nr:thioredoxin [Gammaproteobacteria bacterium]